MHPNQLRARRLTAEIPNHVLAAKAGLDPSRLSAIERCRVRVGPEQLERIANALDSLIAARKKVQQVAAAVGYPVR